MPKYWQIIWTLSSIVFLSKRYLTNSTLLAKFDEWTNDGVAYENLQARICGCILMSLSNQYGYLVLTTSNKSETAVGYCTLYGDMAGGFAVIKDVPKMVVYELSKYINKIAGKNIIPKGVITRAPSAELRPNQKDEDSLPPYSLLDRIIRLYVEEDKSPEQIEKQGIDINIIKEIIKRTIETIITSKAANLGSEM